jgi:hypothetical protein
MNVRLAFGISVALGFVAWSMFSALYIWPSLRGRSRADALRPLLMVHAFRFIGLAFLVPGVVAPELPMAFAHAAAWGDLVACVLALLTLATLPGKPGVGLAWIFNLWGAFDVLDAFYQANASGLAAGQFGAAFFIPTFVVPLLLVTHGLMFRILVSPGSTATFRQERAPKLQQRGMSAMGGKQGVSLVTSHGTRASSLAKHRYASRNQSFEVDDR